MKFQIAAFHATTLPFLANAFAPMLSQQSCESALNMSNANLLRPLGTVAAAASFLLGPIDANAQEDFAFASSSIQVSEQIKVLDMGLPSYNDLSKPTASVANIKGVEPVESSSDSKGTSSVIPTKASGGNVAGSMFASSGPSKKTVAEKEKKKAQRIEAEEVKASGIQTVDFSMPSYDDNTKAKSKSAFKL